MNDPKPEPGAARAGGCQCGAVRYVTAAPRDRYWCHCRMCQRATGGVAAAFVNVAKADLRWEKGEPAYFMSSPIGRRGFCAACGTPLCFDYPDSPRMDLTAGSLDEPPEPPNMPHFGVESRVPGWIPADDLPAMRSDEYAPLAERWAKAGSAPE